MLSSAAGPQEENRPACEYVSPAWLTRRNHAETRWTWPHRGPRHHRRRLRRRRHPAAAAHRCRPTAAPTAEATAAPTAEPTATPAAALCDEKLKVGLVTDVGRINDKGFNQSAYEGMEAATALAPSCFETDYIETTSQSDYAKNIAEFADNGYDVVIGVGFLLGDAMGDAAKAYPNAKFISIDGAPGTGHDESWMTNGESLFYAEDEAGYLAGVLAASLTKSNTIGVVGGLLVVPPVERFVEGYINGAKATKSDITVKFTYTSSFTEPEQGKAAAQQMIDADADVIFAAGGLTGNGALLAACDAGMLAIGVDTDQFLTLPEADPCLVSSATKDIVASLQASLLRIAVGKFTAGIHDEQCGEPRASPSRRSTTTTTRSRSRP